MYYNNKCNPTSSTYKYKTLLWNKRIPDLVVTKILYLFKKTQEIWMCKVIFGLGPLRKNGFSWLRLPQSIICCCFFFQQLLFWVLRGEYPDFRFCNVGRFFVPTRDTPTIEQYGCIYSLILCIDSSSSLNKSCIVQ